MTTLKDIEDQATEYADARDQLAVYVRNLERDIEAAKKKHRAAIRDAASEAANHRKALEQLIDDNRDLFKKPKTQTWHGIKVGIKKAKGKLVYSNEAAVVKRIKQLFDDQIGTLIDVVEKPVKSSLMQLPASDLKKLGVEIVGDGDQVYIKAADTDIDKIVDVMLSDDETRKVA